MEVILTIVLVVIVGILIALLELASTPESLPIILPIILPDLPKAVILDVTPKIIKSIIEIPSSSEDLYTKSINWAIRVWENSQEVIKTQQWGKLLILRGYLESKIVLDEPILFEGKYIFEVWTFEVIITISIKDNMLNVTMEPAQKWIVSTTRDYNVTNAQEYLLSWLRDYINYILNYKNYILNESDNENDIVYNLEFESKQLGKT